jgi:hypothetical protein
VYRKYGFAFINFHSNENLINGRIVDVQTLVGKIFNQISLFKLSPLKLALVLKNKQKTPPCRVPRSFEPANAGGGRITVSALAKAYRVHSNN